ncbi:MAG: hypothetical protein QGH42_05505 [Kiritimatiellia bacterium]|nr:hypothetical protein [Kiritimatiellia bacterium]MDP6811516.1 hypothetical protein [Kiritimatiellia bacterium]MDP7023688.1 hypothetical protein [Kiritimatiellia bacterium]
MAFLEGPADGGFLAQELAFVIYPGVGAAAHVLNLKLGGLNGAFVECDGFTQQGTDGRGFLR